jgi:RNA polymerase sigma factor (sigma-70 family)
MKSTGHKPISRSKRMMVAVVLGSALSAWSSSNAAANDATLRAVSAIDRYCTACWRNAHVHPSYWSDCTQEVFCRLLERVPPDAWGEVLKDEGDERREFLRAIDTVKKRQQRSRKFLSGNVDAVADNRDVHFRSLTEERQAVRQAAEELLSERQRFILERGMHGYSVTEIGRELGIPAERVSDEKYKAVHKLRTRLAPQL